MMKKIFLIALILVSVLSDSMGQTVQYRRSFEDIAKSQEHNWLKRNGLSGLNEKGILKKYKASLRSEDVSFIYGTPLKKYAVIVGSYGNKANAEELFNTLSRKMYAPTMVLDKNGMYRVAYVTSDYLEYVIAMKEEIKKDYPDSWLLFVREITNSKSTNEPLLVTRPQKEPDVISPSAPVSSEMTNDQDNELVDTPIDTNIPKASKENRNVFAVVIGNEKYESVSEVPFAENDAKVFSKYVQQTLGVPAKQIKLVSNGTLNGLRMAIKWLADAMSVCGGQGEAIFYYAGHGIPDEKNKTAFLLPVDGIGNDPESGYALDRLYKEFAKMPAKKVTVFLDACFSGSKRQGDMLVPARAVFIKVKHAIPEGKMVVFTAAQGDETAYPFEEKQHGMFTYYLLKKIQETKGEVTLGDLGDYLTNEVARQSFIENGKKQTPTATPSASFTSTWREEKLK